MPIEPRPILETYFQTGDVPTADQFKNVLDSYVHLEDDNVTVFLAPGESRKRFGINNTEPEAPLGITATGTDEDLIAFNHKDAEDASWFFDLNPADAGNPGFNIDQVVGTGKVSRFFIQESDGYIGVGTYTPDEQLHIQNSTGSGVTAIHLLNTATAINNGFKIGHLNSAITEQDGSLGIFENTAVDANCRMTFRSGGNVGITSLIPDTLIHVGASIDLSLPQYDVDLFPGTGIATIGPMTNNIVADYRGIQARTGTPSGSTYDLDASELNLQRLGGDILIHGDMDIATSSKILITNNGRVGVGTLTPAESIHTIGGVTVGNTSGTTNGTIRYTGFDFEGLIAGVWRSMTGSVPPPPFSPWTQGTGNDIYYLAGTDSQVGIGTNSPTATLHIEDMESVTNGNISAIIHNNSTTSGTAFGDHRVGVQISNNGPWTSSAKNIGLYIPDVSGITENESNIAAMLNGNVAIGDITSSLILGAGANRVLSIMNGTPPSPPPAGVTALSVQIYSDALPGTLMPTFHVMRANGEVVKLYREAALTAADTSTITDSYDIVTEGVINNLRTRLNDLEARLQAHGLLA